MALTVIMELQDFGRTLAAELHQDLEAAMAIDGPDVKQHIFDLDDVS